jgi:hypothetical protein
MLSIIEREPGATDGELFSPPAPSANTIAAKRALIESELQKDASRSDREIARIVGCDHKTVGTARAKFSPKAGIGDHVAATPGDVTGIIAHALSSAGLDPSDPSLFPILTAAAQRNEKKFNPFDPKPDNPDDLCLIAPERLGLACFVNTRNNVVIANGNMRDGIDEMVQLHAADIPALISRLREIQSEFEDGQYEHNELIGS